MEKKCANSSHGVELFSLSLSIDFCYRLHPGMMDSLTSFQNHLYSLSRWCHYVQIVKSLEHKRVLWFKPVPNLGLVDLVCPILPP